MTVQSNGGATREPVARTSPPGWVYVLEAQTTKLVKIGMAFEDPERRLRALQGASPDRLIVLAVYWSDTRSAWAEESRLHEIYRRHRAHGEWFRPEDGLTDWAWHDTPTPRAVKKRCQAALDSVWKRRG